MGWKILNLKTNTILIFENKLAILWIESLQLPKSKYQVFFLYQGIFFL